MQVKKLKAFEIPYHRILQYVLNGKYSGWFSQFTVHNKCLLNHLELRLLFKRGKYK